MKKLIVTIMILVLVALTVETIKALSIDTQSNIETILKK